LQVDNVHKLLKLSRKKAKSDRKGDRRERKRRESKANYSIR